MFRKFRKDKSGATAIEYTLLAALIGVALIATLQTLGGAIKGKLGEVNTALGAKAEGGKAPEKKAEKKPDGKS